jgi:hypothetical protein
MDRTLMRDLREHCAYLSLIIREMPDSEKCGPDDGWIRVVEWLKIASGIIGISFDSAEFEDDCSYCSRVGEYDARRSETLSEVVLKLARFSFVWGALEATVNLIEAESHPAYSGKINKACYFLKTQYDPDKPIAPYEELIRFLRGLIQQSPLYNYERDKDRLEDGLGLQPHVGISGMGLYAVYKIRNRFAHGSIQFPEAARRRSAARVRR